MSVACLVMAAGSGARFGALKQFAEVADGVRLVDRAVSTAGSVADWTGVVLPAGRTWDGPPVDHACSGGLSRQDSIGAGLAAVPTRFDVILIHSASHPLASISLARRAIAAVEAGADGAVPLLNLVDVLKRRAADGLVTVGRTGLGLAQSPMAFSRPVLDAAFKSASDRDVKVVEESELVESVGGRVVAVPGEMTNLHVVDQVSLAMARAIAALVPVV